MKSQYISIYAARNLSTRLLSIIDKIEDTHLRKKADYLIKYINNSIIDAELLNNVLCSNEVKLCISSEYMYDLITLLREYNNV